ncbi:hypothetical protein [Verrucosispora sp. TAA-831]|uniref:hypothetical protein n=1 Tax=Verrucosispora sp. TAA-831 TaxID=3422227 RepID=UPI003D6FE085
MASDAYEPVEVSMASDAGAPPAGSRRRRILPLVAVTTVVAVAVGLAVWFARPAPEPDPVTGQPPSAPVEFAPDQQMFYPGHLPGPVRAASYVTEPDIHTITMSGYLDSAGDSGRSDDDEDWRVEILMAARGADVHRFDREYDEEGELKVPGDPVAPVHGRPAFQTEWETSRILVWEYAPDAWIRMTVTSVDRPGETTRRVAEGIRWVTTPLPLPFEVTGLPDGAVLERTTLQWSQDGPTSSSAEYLMTQIEGAHERPFAHTVTVGLSTESLASRRDNETEDVTVAGRAATAHVFKNKGSAGTYRVGQLPGGCASCVAELHIPTRPASTGVGDRDDALKLAASIRLVEGREDPAGWRFW